MIEDRINTRIARNLVDDPKKARLFFKWSRRALRREFDRYEASSLVMIAGRRYVLTHGGPLANLKVGT